MRWIDYKRYGSFGNQKICLYGYRIDVVEVWLLPYLKLNLKISNGLQMWNFAQTLKKNTVIVMNLQLNF